ncbi:MAG: TIGR00296 family protein [Nitrososphaerota archaeon]
MISDEVGAFLVRLARSAIESQLGLQRAPEPPRDSQLAAIRRGVFVTLYTYESKELRGCMGIPIPQTNIIDDTIRAAKLAAFRDPRFPGLTSEEVGSVILEISLLTEPELFKVEPRSLPEHIRIGIDGLIIEADEGAGLLLPQVPVEYGWTPEEFLMHLCLKAGLRVTDWLRKDVKIYRFAADIFAEEEPRGAIRRVSIMPRAA